MQTSSAPDPHNGAAPTRGMGIGLKLSLVGITVLAILIVGTFVVFFVKNVQTITPTPTLTPTMNETATAAVANTATFVFSGSLTPAAPLVATGAATGVSTSAATLNAAPTSAATSAAPPTAAPTLPTTP